MIFYLVLFFKAFFVYTNLGKVALLQLNNILHVFYIEFIDCVLKEIISRNGI